MIEGEEESKIGLKYGMLSPVVRVNAAVPPSLCARLLQGVELRINGKELGAAGLIRNSDVFRTDRTISTKRGRGSVSLAYARP